MVLKYISVVITGIPQSEGTMIHVLENRYLLLTKLLLKKHYLTSTTSSNKLFIKHILTIML